MSVKVWVGLAFWILGIGLSNIAIAQNKDPEGEIEDAEIVIKKNRKIELPAALMPSEKIAYPLKPEPKKQYDFNYVDYKLRLPDLDARIRVLTMKDEPLEPLSNTFIQGGIGNLGSTLFRAWHGTKRTDGLAWSVGLEHFANRRGPETYLPSGWSENRIYGNWEKAFRKSILSGSVNLGRERYNFYGYPESFGISKDQAKRVLMNGTVSVNLQSRPDSLSFYYALNTEVTSFGSTRNFPESNFRDISENGIGVSGFIGKNIGGKKELIFGGRFNYLSNQGAGLDYQRLRSEFYNQLRTKYKDWNFGIGYRLVHQNDTLSGSEAFNAYPMLEANTLLKNKALKFTAIIDGDNEWVTLQGLMRRNPWLNRGVPAFNNHQPIRASLNLATAANQNWQWQLGLTQKWVRHFALFETNFPDSGRFDVKYLNRTIAISSFNAGLKYQSKSRWGADLQGEYLYFSNLGGQKLYHTPNARLSAGVTYNLKNKVIIGSRLTAWSAVYANRPDGTSKKLNGLIDWDIDLDYKFSRRFGLFLQLDNLLNQQNQPFQFYPSRGFMFILGIKATL